MLKVAVTVSKKATFSHHSQRCFLNQFNASVGRVEKDGKKKRSVYPLTEYPALIAQNRIVKASRWILKCVYSVSWWLLLPSVQVADTVVPAAYTWVRKRWLAWRGCLLRSGFNHKNFQRVPQTSASAHCQDLFAPYLIRKQRQIIYIRIFSKKATRIFV